MRILLCSDLHLGMKFSAYPEARAALAEERFLCLERIVAEADRRHCDLLVVAGDLFERAGVTRRDIERAAGTIARFGGKLTAVLPGNHDFLAPDDELWRRFGDASGDRVLVLAAARAYALDHFDLPGVSLYPGPCTGKHSATNAIAWIRGESAGAFAEASHAAPERLAIGVAHGSVEGYSPDFAGEYYPMGVAELRDAGPRLWLLGHTHTPFTASPAPDRLLACAGTPEPDGFDCRHGGGAMEIEIGAGGATTVVPIETGRYRFVDETVDLAPEADLEELGERFGGERAARTLLRLTLKGTVRRQNRAALAEIRSALERRLLYVDWRDGELRDEVDQRLIDEEYPAGSFPHELLSALAAAGDGAGLESAYELLRESRA